MKKNICIKKIGWRKRLCLFSLLFILSLALPQFLFAGSLKGTVKDKTDNLIPWSIITYMVKTTDGGFIPVTGAVNYPPGIGEPPEGGFILIWDDLELANLLNGKTIKEEFLIVQPPNIEAEYGIYNYQPRFYQKPAGLTENINIQLPLAATFVIKAYDTNGDLIRWRDFIALGTGAQNFLYLTDLNDEVRPAIVWPVHDAVSRANNTLWEEGLPAVILQADQVGPYAINAQFWLTKDYGKLILKADNPIFDKLNPDFATPQGFGVPPAAENYMHIIEFNPELAKTAIANIARREKENEGYYSAYKKSIYDGDWAMITQYKGMPIEQIITDLIQVSSLDADTALDNALRIRDELEFEAAKGAVEAGKGTVDIQIYDGLGNPIQNCPITMRQISHDHSFLTGGFVGIPEGSIDYHYYTSQNRQYAYRKGKEAGFEITPILPGWFFTVENEFYNPADPSYYFIDHYFPEEINKVCGMHKINPSDPDEPDALTELGYKIKAHGTAFLFFQLMVPYVRKPNGTTDIIINPDGTYNLDLFQQDLLEHQELLLDAYIDYVDIWEIMNEPGYTNCAGLPMTAEPGEASIFSLFDSSAEDIQQTKETKKPSLESIVNSAHEFDFGFKYYCYGLEENGADNNKLYDDFKVTYSEFLEHANNAELLDTVDIIGLQLYPGIHIEQEGFETGDSPAFSPSSALDTVQRYYDRFGKISASNNKARKIHITEISLPSEYQDTWRAGYWREKWNPATQADYIERVLTLMFAHPAVESLIWWDILDKGAFTTSGGLISNELDEFGDMKVKPSYEKIKNFLGKEKETITDANGQAEIKAFAGEYEIVIGLPGGDITKSIRVNEQTTTVVNIGNTPSILYGDVSLNGEVTSYDAALVAQHVVGIITLDSTQLIRADVSGNGTVSSLDAALIAQYVVGIITKFPVEGGE